MLKRMYLFFEHNLWEQKKITLKKYALGLLLCIVSGILTGLSFPTTDLFPLAWISIFPMLVLCAGVSPLRAWGYGFISGLSYWLTIAYWMHTFHPFSLFSAIPALGLYYSLPFLLSALWRKRVPRFSRFSPVVFLVVWIAVEYFRSKGFLAFSWGVLGYSQYLFLPVIQIADIFSVYGVSALLLLSNTVPALAVLNRGKNSFPRVSRYALVSGVLLVLALGYGAIRLLEKRPEGGMRVAMVQGFTDPATDLAGAGYRTWRTVGKDRIALKDRRHASRQRHQKEFSGYEQSDQPLAGSVQSAGACHLVGNTHGEKSYGLLPEPFQNPGKEVGEAEEKPLCRDHQAAV